MGASVDAGEWEGREETEIEFAMFKSTPADGDEHKNHSDHWRKENEITGPAWGEKSGLIGSRGRDPSAAKLKAFRSRDRTPPFAKPNADPRAVSRSQGGPRGSVEADHFVFG